MLTAMYIRPEYCDGPFYTGWHLYLRETNDGEANDRGEWGWIRRGDCLAHRLSEALADVDHPKITYPYSAAEEIREWNAFVLWFVQRYQTGLTVLVDSLPYPRTLEVLKPTAAPPSPGP